MTESTNQATFKLLIVGIVQIQTEMLLRTLQICNYKIHRSFELKVGR